MNKFSLSLILLLLSAGLFGQGRQVTGIVTDDQLEPLIGATIVVQSASGASSVGASTDMDGKFSINVPSGSNSLLVTYIGFENQTVNIAGKTDITIVLKTSALELEDVVVTALGIKKEKKALGYAFSDVKGDELTANRDVNFINAVSNKIAGVQISQTAGGAGTSARIMIRGIKSLSTESQPLIVIDGIALDNNSDGASWLGGVDYGNSLVGISPDDIETMSVLKGPNAAALYGSRASNGAIIITTKTASAQDKLKITVNSNITFDRVYIMANYQNEYGAGFGGGIQFQALSESQVAKHSRDSAYYYYSTGSWGPKMDGTLEVLNWNDEFTYLTPQPNNVKDYFSKGFTLTNSVSLENGTDKLNWRFSVSDLENKGLKPNSNYDRKNINFNINSKMNDIISFSFNSNYLRENAFNRVGQGDSRTGARTFIWMPRSINMETLRDDYMTDNGYEQNWYKTDSWHTNPYWEAFENYNNDNKDQFRGYAKINLDFTPWLKGYVRSSMDTYTSKRYTRIANNAMRANGDGSYSEYIITRRALNHDFLLSADQSFGELKVALNAGGAIENYVYNYTRNSITKLAVPNFFSLNNAYSADDQDPYTKISQKQLNSLYASAQLSYKSWLYTEITARRDRSSALFPDNSTFFYPSLNTSFIFSDAFELKNDIFTFGKIRFSIAEVGNDTSPHQLSIEYINEQYGDAPSTYLNSRVTNPALVPENTKSWEVGADMRFFMNRLSLDITYYNETTFNQIVIAELSKTTGFSNMLTNGGAISNKGLEIQSSFTPIKNENFEWNININWAKNKNMVEYLVEGLDQFPVTGTSQINILAIAGNPYGQIVGTSMERYYKRDGDGNIIDDPNNGSPLIGDDGLYVMGERKVIGNITPEWTGGISNNIRYKNISLAFSIGVSFGGDIYSKTNKYGLDNGQFVETLEGRESWYAATSAERQMGRVGLYNTDGTPMLDADENQMFDENGSSPVGYVPEGILEDGTENIKGIDPQVYFHQRKWGGIAELDVYDASYVKLRDLSINYNFPSKFFEDTFISRASCSVFGKNLWLIYSGVPNIDPESSFTSNTNGLGQEYAAMPTTRSVGFNFRIEF